LEWSLYFHEDCDVGNYNFQQSMCCHDSFCNLDQHETCFVQCYRIVKIKLNFKKKHLVFLLSSWFERGSIKMGHCSVFLFTQLVGFKTNKVLLCSRLLRINSHQCTRTIVTLASRV
jgi:hypothetical protein